MFFSSFLAGIKTETRGGDFKILSGSLKFFIFLNMILLMIKLITIMARAKTIKY